MYVQKDWMNGLSIVPSKEMSTVQSDATIIRTAKEENASLTFSVERKREEKNTKTFYQNINHIFSTTN
jgi:hypothetical protein